jgi:hypothetical protein
MRTPIVWSLLALCAACSGGSAAPAGATAYSSSPYVTSVSDSGALRVEVRTSPQPPTQGTNDVELTVTSTTDGHPVDGLSVAAGLWMAAMNHGSSTIPTIAAEGDGKYLVQGLDLFMAGHWQLRVTFTGPVDDHVSPALDVP